MRRHRRVLLGKSGIPDAGWGLFTKESLKKGDYIDEYVGELISSDEAERRGQINDHQNSSYIFIQSSDFSLDAYHKGNKTRFANDRRDPNVATEMMFVNGDKRVMFKAKTDIPAQSEVSQMLQKSFFSWLQGSVFFVVHLLFVSHCDLLSPHFSYSLITDMKKPLTTI